MPVYACVRLVVSDSWQLMDCSPPGSSVHGIFQARILDRLPFPTSRDLPDPRIEFQPLASSALAGGFFSTVPPGTWCLFIRKTKGKGPSFLVMNS